MAVQLVFIILVMIIVAVIAIRMFVSQTSTISQISDTQLQQAIAQCQNAYRSSPVTFCQTSVSLGSGTYLLDKSGINACGPAVACTALVQAINSRDIVYNGFPLTPIACAWLLCENNIKAMSGAEATWRVFGEWASGSQNSPYYIQIKNSASYLNIVSEGSIPYGLKSCSGGYPNWVQYYLLNSLGKLLTYFLTNYQSSCKSLSLEIEQVNIPGIGTKSIPVIKGDCPAANVESGKSVPLCEFLVKLQYTTVAQSPDLIIS